MLLIAGLPAEQGLSHHPIIGTLKEEYSRPPPENVMEDVIEHMCVDVPILIAFIHENFLNFMDNNDTDATFEIANYFSQADLLMATDWDVCIQSRFVSLFVHVVYFCYLCSI
jgi:hypothetical protein